MKKFLEESEKQEPCGKESEEEKRSDDGAHTETRGIAQGYLGGGGEKEKGKAQIRIFRANNQEYGMQDIQRGQRAWMGQSQVETGGCVKPDLGLCTQ